MDERNLSEILRQLTRRIDEHDRHLANLPARWPAPAAQVPVRLVKISDWTKNSSGFYEVRPVRGEVGDIDDKDILNQKQGDFFIPPGFATDAGPQDMTLGSTDEACIGLNAAESIRAGAHVLRRGTVQLAIRVGTSVTKGQPSHEGRDVWMMVSPSAEHLFAVDLTQDGGSDGNATGPTACTYTYTAKTKGGSDGGQTVGTNLSPERGRPFMASFSVGTKGIGYYDDTNFVLWDTNEQLGAQTNCT
jgi:hypothetical protein